MISRIAQSELFPLKAEGPRVGAFGVDLVLRKRASSPRVGAADADLVVVDIQGDDITLRDVDGVTTVLKIEHEAGVGPTGEEVVTEGGGGETLALCVGERDVAEVGEVTGFLWLDVGEEEVVDGGLPLTDDATGFAVRVGFVRAVSEP